MTGTVMNADAQTSWRLTGVVSIMQGLLIFVPTIVLGQAIGWPASSGVVQASVALPRLLETGVSRTARMQCVTCSTRCCLP
jgi:hypothetical protein